MKPNHYNHPPEPGKTKNFTQVISIIFGALLFILGLATLLYPAFAGLHISSIHALIISTAGGTLFYLGGFKDNAYQAYLCCLGLGVFFGVLSILGFLFGKSGVPTVGFKHTDKFLWAIIPGFQELGKNDHILAGIISLFLMGGAIDWLRRHTKKVTPPKKTSIRMIFPKRIRHG